MHINVRGVFVYVGQMNVSMALIQQTDLMIDNDSGPAHVAKALKVPTLVLVGIRTTKIAIEIVKYIGTMIMFFIKKRHVGIYFSLNVFHRIPARTEFV